MDQPGSRGTLPKSPANPAKSENNSSPYKPLISEQKYLPIQKEKLKERKEFRNFPRMSWFPSNSSLSPLSVTSRSHPLTLSSSLFLFISLSLSVCLRHGLSLFVSLWMPSVSVSEPHFSVYFFPPDIKGQKRNLPCAN